MATFNKVIIAGNLTRDPELKHTAKGTAICNLSLAINRKYKTDSGESKEDVTFVEVAAWGRTGELAGEYLKKGRPVLIEGRLKTESWEDKESHKKRSKMVVVAENIQFLGSGSGEGRETGGEPERTPSAKARTPAVTTANDDDSDVPF